MATPDWTQLESSTRRKEQRRTDERMNQNENRKQPVYYQGVYRNDQSANNSGDVTPVSLRPPMPGGFLNLPRYVPKYTINSRLQQNDLFPPSSSSVDAENIRNQNRRSRGNAGNDDSGGSAPRYKETPQEKVYSNEDQTYVNHDQTSEKTSSAPHRNHGAKNKPGKRRTRSLSSRRSDPGRRKKDCCRRCCSCPGRSRCRCAECSPLARRVVCAVVVFAVIAAVLAAIALSLYFAYYEQMGDETPISANFTIRGVEFPAYLLDLANPKTNNVTEAVCKAFETTLQDLDGVVTEVFSCSAVEYRNGSITSIFNLDVRHQRDTFMRTPDAFLSAIRDKLRDDFGDPSDGRFYGAISRSLDAGSGFEIRLNSVDWGHISTPETAAKTTVGMTTVGTTTVAMSASVNASGFGSKLTNSSASETTVSNAPVTIPASVSRSHANTSLGNKMTTSVVATTTGRPTSNVKANSSSTTLTSRTSVHSSGKQGHVTSGLSMSTNRKAGISVV